MKKAVSLISILLTTPLFVASLAQADGTQGTSSSNTAGASVDVHAGGAIQSATVNKLSDTGPGFMVGGKVQFSDSHGNALSLGGNIGEMYGSMGSQTMGNLRLDDMTVLSSTIGLEVNGNIVDSDLLRQRSAFEAGLRLKTDSAKVKGHVSTLLTIGGYNDAILDRTGMTAASAVVRAEENIDNVLILSGSAEGGILTGGGSQPTTVATGPTTAVLGKTGWNQIGGGDFEDVNLQVKVPIIGQEFYVAAQAQAERQGYRSQPVYLDQSVGNERHDSGLAISGGLLVGGTFGKAE